MSRLVICNEQDLIDIADAIRTKSGITKDMSFPDDFINGINSCGYTIPNLITINYQTTNNEPVRINYIGIDQDNNIKSMSTNEGVSGSFTTIAYSTIQITATSVGENSWGEETYATISSVEGTYSYTLFIAYDDNSYGHVPLFGINDTLTIGINPPSSW